MLHRYRSYLHMELVRVTSPFVIYLFLFFCFNQLLRKAYLYRMFCVTADDVVPYRFGEKSAQSLGMAGFRQVIFKQYEG